MRRFSERAGFRTSSKSTGADGIEPGLRNRLWNLVWSFWLNTPVWNPQLQDFILQLWDQYFKRPTDALVVARVLPEIRDYFFAAPWYEVLDFVEFCARAIPEEARRAEFARCLNQVLEEEDSAYRFVDGALVRVAQPCGEDEALRSVSQEVWEALDCLESWRISDSNGESTIEHMAQLVAELPQAARSLLGAMNRMLASVLEPSRDGSARPPGNGSVGHDASGAEMRLAVVLCAILLRFLALRWRRIAQSVDREMLSGP